jgi:hypothetical protein
MNNHTIENAGAEVKRRWRVLATAAIATLVTVLAVATTGPATLRGSAAPAANAIHSVPMQLTPAELTAWQTQTASPAGRAAVVRLMREAFAGVATVGTGPRDLPGATINTGHIQTAAYAAGIRPAVATGITGDHFWIIVSYADVVNGAIWGAVRACQTRLPGWLCTSAGNLLASWAQGWGAASNHGLWAEIYWAPPHVNAGRW